MPKFTNAKADVLAEMAAINDQMKLLIIALDIHDSLADMDLHDQITSMLHAQKTLAITIEKATRINSPE